MKTQPTSLFEILAKYEPKKGAGYISQEFQDYGYRLSVDLEDPAHRSLYIRMAKTIDRAILETARSYVMDATTARSRARVFMWKVKELKKSSILKV